MPMESKGIGVHKEEKKRRRQHVRNPANPQKKRTVETA